MTVSDIKHFWTHRVISSDEGTSSAGVSGVGSDSVLSNGANLKIDLDHVAPGSTWRVSAVSGHGGSGGGGANYGDSGAAGAASGSATALLLNKVATMGVDGGSLVIKATSGEAGTGGQGGVGDPDTAGPAGNGGNGGSAASAFAKAHAFQFTGGTLDMGVEAQGGNGGTGGGGGSGLGVLGNGGNGGNAGNATAILNGSTFQLTGDAPNTLTLTVNAVAGKGGDAGGPGHHDDSDGIPGTGGHGGDASTSVTNNSITGGVEDDTVEFLVGATAGDGGFDGYSTPGSDLVGAGTASIKFTNNHVYGGGGTNTLAFWSFGREEITTDSVTVNLADGTFALAGAGNGNTVAGFQNVVGGNGNDNLTGDANANAMWGEDGSDTIKGGGGDDALSGQAGADSLTGGDGADHIYGGADADTFVYASVTESTSVTHDTLLDLDFSQDHIDVRFNVTAIDTAVTVATINAASFDADLAAAADSHHLRRHHAVLVTADDGDQFNHTFLVVDANGTAGYQSGEDLVIDVTNASHSDALSVDTFI